MILVLSADHVIQDVDAFHQAINIASNQAQAGKSATFGIVPTDANIGYGYIKSSQENIDGAHKVEKFVEKPDLVTAQTYLEQGDYLWNSGMFMFQADVLISGLSEHSPNIVVSAIDSVTNAAKDLDFIRLDKQAFESSPSDSIDYALMDKPSNVVVVPLVAKWNDISTKSMLSHINVSTGKDVTIREMAETMKEVIGFKGKLTFDTTKPDGAPRKLINVTRLENMGWKYSVDLRKGIEKTYDWYLKGGL